MLLRQWMEPHKWMVDYTQQTEWIERKGILVCMAEVFGSMGPGLYLVSLFYNNLWGMLAAWIIIVFFKVPIHLVYFGKPSRFWRTLPPFSNAWRTSWIARGILFTIIFIGITLIQITITYFSPDTVWDITFRVISGMNAVVVGIYSGFVFNYCRSVPFWNSPLLPLVFLINGIADGFALIMALGIGDTQFDLVAAEAGSRIILFANAIIISIYLWHAVNKSKTSRYSAILLMRGSLALPFWLGVIASGIIIPLVISVSGYLVEDNSITFLITAIAMHTMGTIALKYCLLKAGIHGPIIPVTAST